MRFLAYLLFQLTACLCFGQIEDSTKTKVEDCGTPECRVTTLVRDGWQFVGSEPRKALDYALEAQKDSSQISRPLLLDSLFRFSAFAYGNLNNRPMTLKSHLKRQEALKGARSEPELRALASSYFETAGVLMGQDDVDLAAPYYLKCVNLTRKINYQTQLGQALMELGEIYGKRGDLDSARLMLSQGTDVFRHIERLIFIVGYGQIRTALMLEENGLLEEAVELADSALTWPVKPGYEEFTSQIYQGAGIIFHKAGNNQKAIQYLTMGRKLMEAHSKLFYLPNTYRYLANAYQSSNSDSAFKYLEKYVEINDSVLNIENNKRIAELQIEHQEVENKRAIRDLENQKAIANQEKELAERNEQIAEAASEKQQQVITITAVALVVVLVLMIFLIRVLRQSRQQNVLIAEQKAEVEEKNREIYDSISYAQRIQQAIMPDTDELDELFPESFVFYRPKDQLSGDFYWCGEATNSRNAHLKIFAVGDCTGHGVPGALVSILGVNYLKLGETSEHVNSPADALGYLNRGIFTIFQSSEQTIRDGMDITLGAIDYQQMKLFYACAKNPVYIVRNNEVITLKGDRHPIGKSDFDHPVPFTDRQFDLENDDMIYMCSDGFQDQFGGPHRKKFKLKQFKELMSKAASNNCYHQRQLFEREFDSWIGNVEQIDDVCVFGIRVKP